MVRTEEYLESWGSDWAKNVGNKIRRDRKSQGWTIRELAEKIQVSPTHLNRMEKGDRPLDSTRVLVRICKTCAVPIESYLPFYGWEYTQGEKPVRYAFPKITTEVQEEAVVSFADMIATRGLSDDEIGQIMNQVTAYVEFCEKKKKKESSSGEQ